MNEVLVVENISKSYYNHDKNLSRFLSWFIGTDDKTQKVVLKDISFSAKSGEAIGLIGVNGAGKSTLLKIISNTLTPTSGSVKVNGKIASILELGMGFHPELTGRQNVYQACSLMGFGKSDIDDFIGYIENFSELGSFFDEKIRIYSSGMQARLAFSVVTAYRPDILIIDEALSVGDVYFQHKSFERIKKFKELGTTLIIVSHDSTAIKSICDRVILLDGCSIVADGEPENVLDLYNALLSKRSGANIVQKKLDSGKISTISGSNKAEFKSVKIVDTNNFTLQVVDIGKRVKLVVEVVVNDDISSLSCGYQIKDRFSQIVYGTNSHHLGCDLENLKKGTHIVYEFEFVANLGVGSFSIALALHSSFDHLKDNYSWQDNVIIFNVVNVNKPEFVGVAYIEPQLKVKVE